MAKFVVAALAVFSFGAVAPLAPAGAQPLQTAAEKATTEASFSAATKMFVLEAANDALLGIETGKIALAVGDERIKAFVERLIAAHTRMAKELEGIVNGKVAFTVPSSLDDAHQDKLDRIKGLTGPEFAKAYLTLQVSVLQETVARLEHYRRDGDNAELKAFAEKHLTPLREHQQTAQKLLDEK